MKETQITFIPKRPRKMPDRYTKRDIEYRTNTGVIIIPAGTKYVKAMNLPGDNSSKIKYWAEKWPGMSEEAKSWERNYGFGLTAKDVT